MTPLTKYFWIKGYIRIIGVTIIITNVILSASGVTHSVAQNLEIRESFRAFYCAYFSIVITSINYLLKSSF